MMSNLNLLVTGSETGGTAAQQHALRVLIRGLKPQKLIQGCCVGIDTLACLITIQERCASWGSQIEGWPANDVSPAKRSDWAIGVCTQVCEWLPALDRDDRMAERADLVAAVPDTDDEALRSGTWATVRRARRRGKLTFVIRQDGTVRLDHQGQ